MAIGGPGDHPLSDIITHRFDIYNAKCDSLIREIANFVPASKIEKYFRWPMSQNVPQDVLIEMEKVLTDKLEILKINHQLQIVELSNLMDIFDPLHGLTLDKISENLIQKLKVLTRLKIYPDDYKLRSFLKGEFVSNLGFYPNEQELDQIISSVNNWWITKLENN